MIKFDTAAGYKQKFEEILQTISTLNVSNEHTIEDYPIGGTSRGLCKITVEFKDGKGYRVVKQTTDKSGRWCKPKAGTFMDPVYGYMFACVAVGDAVERGAAWLIVKTDRIYFDSVTGRETDLIESPSYSPPKRGVDSDDECDAYEAWIAGVQEVCSVLKCSVLSPA